MYSTERKAVSSTAQNEQLIVNYSTRVSNPKNFALQVVTLSSWCQGCTTRVAVGECNRRRMMQGRHGRANKHLQKEIVASYSVVQEQGNATEESEK